MLNLFSEVLANQADLNIVLFSKLVLIEFIPIPKIKIYKMHFKRLSNELSFICSWGEKT